MVLFCKITLAKLLSISSISVSISNVKAFFKGFEISIVYRCVSCGSISIRLPNNVLENEEEKLSNT